MADGRLLLQLAERARGSGRDFVNSQRKGTARAPDAYLKYIQKDDIALKLSATFQHAEAGLGAQAATKELMQEGVGGS